MPAIESAPRAAGAALANNDIVSRRFGLIASFSSLTGPQSVRCPAAPTFCRIPIFLVRRSGTEPRIAHSHRSAPNSIPCRPEPEARTKYRPNRLRSPATLDSAMNVPTGHFANEGMGRAVIDRRRPVLPDRCIRRDGQAIGVSTSKALPVLVLDRHQIELAGARPLRTEERHGVGDAAAVDGITVWIGKLSLKTLDKLGREWNRPSVPVVVGREGSFVSQIEPRMGFGCRRIQNVLHPFIGTKRFALLDAPSIDRSWPCRG